MAQDVSRRVNQIVTEMYTRLQGDGTHVEHQVISMAKLASLDARNKLARKVTIIQALLERGPLTYAELVQIDPAVSDLVRDAPLSPYIHKAVNHEGSGRNRTYSIGDRSVTERYVQSVTELLGVLNGS